MTKTPDFIPWPAIHPRYNWAARDSDGRIIAFEKRPELLDGRFANGGHWQRIDTITTSRPGSAHWAGSLQNRDEWDKGYPDMSDLSKRMNDVCEDIKNGFEAISNCYSEIAESVRQIEERMRTTRLGGHTSSFVDRVYSLGVESGITAEPTPNGGSRIVLRATPPPPND